MLSTITLTGGACEPCPYTDGKGGCLACPTGTYPAGTGVCLTCPVGTTTRTQNKLGITGCGAKAGTFVSYRMEVNALVDIPADEYNPDSFLAYMQTAVGEDGQATINDIKV